MKKLFTLSWVIVFLLFSSNVTFAQVTSGLIIPITVTPSIADPCSCTDILNKRDAGGVVTHFHDILTIKGSANTTVTLVTGGANFLNTNLSQIPTGTIGTTDAAGDFTIDFWHASKASGSVEVTVGGVPTTPSPFALSVCDATICAVLAPIPTMSEWGSIIFGLLTLNLGLVFLRRKETIIV